MKTPEEIADEAMAAFTLTDGDVEECSAEYIRDQIVAAIEADRAQQRREIYIVQNDLGDVKDVFRDADEATAIYQDGFSIIEESVWEPGEHWEAKRVAEK